MDSENPKPLLRVGNSSNHKNDSQRNFAKKPSTKAQNAEKGRYSMVVDDVKSMKQPKITKSLVPVDLNQMAEEEAKRDKVKKDAKNSAFQAKAEIIRSLNSNIFKETLAQSPALANAAVKTSWKRSDQEMMALLDGRELAKDEVRKIRLTEHQATIRFNSGCGFESDKELKKLFGTKLSANPSLVSNSSASISSNKLMDLKKNSASSPAAQNIIETAKNLKNTYHEKKNYGLSTMSSHRDIVRQIKKSSAEKPSSENETETGKDKPEQDSESSNDSNTAAETPASAKSSEPTTKKLDVVVSDFLKKRIEEIRSNAAAKPRVVNKPLPKKQVVESSDFELEIVIGESRTTKKLMEFGGESTKRRRDDDDEDEPAFSEEKPNKKVKSVEKSPQKTTDVE